MINERIKENEDVWQRLKEMTDEGQTVSDGMLKIFLIEELTKREVLSREELHDWINSQPRAFPERESDEYDAGWSAALDHVFNHL